MLGLLCRATIQSHAWEFTFYGARNEHVERRGRFLFGRTNTGPVRSETATSTSTTTTTAIFPPCAFRCSNSWMQISLRVGSAVLFGMLSIFQSIRGLKVFSPRTYPILPSASRELSIEVCVGVRSYSKRDGTEDEFGGKKGVSNISVESLILVAEISTTGGCSFSRYQEGSSKFAPHGTTELLAMRKSWMGDPRSEPASTFATAHYESARHYK